ncbi:MAG: hypothetical protein KDJ65_01705 [Anaerolineae bacterium]|nr:hypothetical protein [Anaerolineae bacterium]
MSAQPTNKLSPQQTNLLQEEIEFLLNSDIPSLERSLAATKRRLEYLTQITGPSATVSVTLTKEQVQALAEEMQQCKQFALQCPQLSSLALLFITRHLGEEQLTTYLKELSQHAFAPNGN